MSVHHLYTNAPKYKVVHTSTPSIQTPYLCGICTQANAHVRTAYNSHSWRFPNKKCALQPPPAQSMLPRPPPRSTGTAVTLPMPPLQPLLPSASPSPSSAASAVVASPSSGGRTLAKRSCSTTTIACQGRGCRPRALGQEGARRP